MARVLDVPVAKGVGKVAMSDEEIRVYLGVAERVGFRPGQILDLKLQQYFLKRHIAIYDLAEVERFLSRKARELQKGWSWMYLRKEQPYVDFRGRWDGSLLMGDKGDQYNHLIPMSVLGQVEDMIEEFGNSVAFYVSDYTASRPDPFIMVTAPNILRYVFNHWDEPDWR